MDLFAEIVDLSMLFIITFCLTTLSNPLAMALLLAPTCDTESVHP